MNTDLFFSNINKHITLSSEEKDHISQLVVEEKLEKNDFVIQQSNPCQHICFVNSGALRAFHLTPNGKEHTIMFAVSDWWITDMHCFLNEQPAMVSIKAVEPSSIYKLSKSNFDALFIEIPAFNKFFRILMQNAYCREQRRMIQQLSLPAADRYENFLKQYPQIANKVTLKQIASYLGITPEFLSTLRSNKS